MPIKLLLMTLLVFTAACSATPKSALQEPGVVQLYGQANDLMSASKYRAAIESYKRLIKSYPQGRYSEQARIEVIYANYMAGDFLVAKNDADMFIQYYPKNDNVDYVYYLRALSTFEQGTHLIVRRHDSEIAEQGHAMLRESFGFFRELIMRFPNSGYGSDAIARMSLIRNALARHEVVVAADELRNNKYLSAAQRGEYVKQYFPKTPAVPDAMAVQLQAYRLMNEPGHAEDSLQKLHKIYPDYRYLPRLKAGHNDIHVGD